MTPGSSPINTGRGLLPPASQLVPAPGSNGDTFSDQLTRATGLGPTDRPAPPIDPQRDGELREAAQQLVAHTFLAPMMQMVREDPLRGDLFHGGQGEQAFGGQLDQELSYRMTASGRFPLVDAIHEHFRSSGFAAPTAQSRGMEVNTRA
jgi:hypothetical protein